MPGFLVAALVVDSGSGLSQGWYCWVSLLRCVPFLLSSGPGCSASWTGMDQKEGYVSGQVLLVILHLALCLHSLSLCPRGLIGMVSQTMEIPHRCWYEPEGQLMRWAGFAGMCRLHCGPFHSCRQAPDAPIMTGMDAEGVLRRAVQIPCSSQITWRFPSCVDTVV